MLTHPDILEKAERVCHHNAARLTPARRRVLELIWEAPGAIKAYDLLDLLHKEDPSARPPTVYRALDFLMENGLIHKIESMNAYVGCIHPEHRLKGHECQLFICKQCHRTQEFCDEEITERIKGNARQIGFSFGGMTMEVHGLCPVCQRSTKRK